MAERNEKGLGGIVVEEFCRAIPWGITLAVFLFLSISAIFAIFKQDVKEAIDFTQKQAIANAMEAILDMDPEILKALKQNTKEAVEFTVKTVDRDLVAPYKPRMK